MHKLTSDAQLKQWALVFAVAGLIPFLGHVLAIWWFSAPPGPLLVASSQKLYAGLILSFVGALHWGIALSRSQRYDDRMALMLGWSVAPALYAWVVVQLTNQRSLVLLAVGLIVAFLVDALVLRKQADLQWFLRVRLILTVVATACLLATAAML